jgi:hypothetical protein
MADAVALAASMAKPGDAVLLSPACSSFDMFRDYKDRGDVFVREVRALAKKATTTEEPSPDTAGKNVTKPRQASKPAAAKRGRA